MNDKQVMSNLEVEEIAKHDPENCRLCQILARQSKINSKFFMPNKLNAPAKVLWTMKVFIAMIMEAAELLNWMPWKWWKKNQKKSNLVEIKYEIIDMLHFLITLALIWGMDCDDIYSIYLTKAKENIRRQNEGY